MSFSKAIHAKEFPLDEVIYTCRVHPVYIATSREDCLSEQRDWFNQIGKMNLTEKQWNNALWYGYRYNWRGEVVGIDMKLVLDHAKWISRK